MSHAEIWDDSALVDSWNEALDEYKHYHSIHARGEKVEDVLRSIEDRGNLSDALDKDDSARHEATDEVEIPNGMNTEDYGYGNVDEANRNPPLAGPSENKLSEADQGLWTKPSEGRSQGGGSPLAIQQLVGSVHDEGLKSLLMSWYYAGYYTGLYEGQHQAR